MNLDNQWNADDTLLRRLDRLRYYRQEYIVLLTRRVLRADPHVSLCHVVFTDSYTVKLILSVPALSSYPGYPGYPLTQSRKSFPLIAVKLSSIKRSPINIARYGYEINVPHFPEKKTSSLVI